MAVTKMPRNVLRFERLMYFVIVSSLVFSVLDPDPRLQQLIAAKAMVGIVIVGAVIVGLNVLLVWLVARRRKNWVRLLWSIPFLSSACCLGCGTCLQTIKLTPQE